MTFRADQLFNVHLTLRTRLSFDCPPICRNGRPPCHEIEFGSADNDATQDTRGYCAPERITQNGQAEGEKDREPDGGGEMQLGRGGKVTGLGAGERSGVNNL